MLEHVRTYSETAEGHLDDENAIMVENESRRGIRILFGQSYDDDVPDLYIERRPNGWAMILTTIGGEDSACTIRMADDGSVKVEEDQPGSVAFAKYK